MLNSSAQWMQDTLSGMYQYFVKVNRNLTETFTCYVCKLSSSKFHSRGCTNLTSLYFIIFKYTQLLDLHMIDNLLSFNLNSFVIVLSNSLLNRIWLLNIRSNLSIFSPQVVPTVYTDITGHKTDTNQVSWTWTTRFT